MDVQQVIVLILFIVAVIYIGRIIYRMLRSDKGCASNCGKCGADFSSIVSEKDKKVQ